MKYLRAFLEQGENSPLPTEGNRQNRQKPLLSVLSGASGRKVEEIEGGASAAWLCRYCGKPATIEDVFPSLDGERTLTMWRCDPCQTVAVTPDTIRQPPVWIKRTVQ